MSDAIIGSDIFNDFPEDWEVADRVKETGESRKNYGGKENQKA